MANLPLNASLLKNVVTNVPGFGLEDRYFFVPGFPSMARDMVVEALDKYYPSNQQKYRLSLKALCSENLLIDTMKKIPSNIDMSSLPQIDGDNRAVIISISSYDEGETKNNFNIFIEYLENNNIPYTFEDK